MKMAGTLLALMLLSACGKGRGGDPRIDMHIQVAAASSLRDLLSNYSSPIRSTCSFEASSTLSRQIESGAKFDVFLSADADSVDRLGDLVERSSRRVFLTNRLALLLPPGVGEGGLESIPAGTKIAVAGPEVPAGKAWRKYLEAAGRKTDFEPRFVVVDSVRAALAMFDSSAVDAALVYATDAAVAKRKHSDWIPKDGPVIEYVAVAIKGGASKVTDLFLRKLSSPEFLKDAKAFGFMEPSVK